MMKGICIYAESANQVLDATFHELLAAAHIIKNKTDEPIQVLLAAEKCDLLVKQICNLAVDELYVIETKVTVLFKDDALSKVMASALERFKPSCVLIPATLTGRSLFSRVAVINNAGLTSDCTGLDVATHDDGSFYIKQNKPSFGSSEMVSIVARRRPQMFTICQGVFSPHKESCSREKKVCYISDIPLPSSSIEIIEETRIIEATESISAAEVVVVAGRGTLEGDNLSMVHKFASKIGGIVAGTRPLSDEGLIPFENQIGQTGCTIKPKICVSFGVSGAIQHVEGLRDVKLFIAVNSDKDAAIFNVADYGVVGDMKEVLHSLVE